MKKLLIAIAAVATMGPVAAFAVPIAVQNASFEQPACQPAGGPGPCLNNSLLGTFVIGSPPGWVFAGFQAGVYRPTGNAFNAGFPTNGVQSGYGNAGSTLTQNNIATIVDGTTYTLLVDVGRRKDSCCTGLLFEILLLADGVSVASVDQTNFVGGPPNLGDWKSISVSFLGDAVSNGKSLGIKLFAGATQTNWDNVRLSDAIRPLSVPEPTTLLLLGLGLAGLGVARRRA
jgi:hypothetical protein